MDLLPVLWLHGFRDAITAVGACFSTPGSRRCFPGQVNSSPVLISFWSDVGHRLAIPPLDTFPWSAGVSPLVDEIPQVLNRELPDL